MRRLSLALILLFAIAAPVFASTATSVAIIEKRDYALWDAVIPDYICQDLWNAHLSYDAGHFLMVPMHAAFALNVESWQAQFTDLFRRFLADAPNYNIAENERLDKLHFLYLASCYLNLSRTNAESSSASTANQDANNASNHMALTLYNLIMQKVTDLWLYQPAWQWDRKAFGGGIRERIVWKLSQRLVWQKHYRAFVDEELFLFAIAGELSRYQKEMPHTKNETLIIEDLLQHAYQVFKKTIAVQNNGGWLFQPGVWSNHPDFIFAGHREKSPGLQPLRVKAVAEDTSHSHRFPLWLKSLSKAFPEGSEQNRYFTEMLAGLERQFFEKVVVFPSADFPSYRTTNYMDGWNGVYRYHYSTIEKYGGYGPFELSGTITIGWWIFLGSERSRMMYSVLAKTFPLPDHVMALYAYPQTRWNKNQDQFRELIVRLASRLS